MAENEQRDIDLVLVTGAGASREFGANHTQLPLMGDWVKQLVRHLAESGAEYVQATGLRPDMTGEEFEQQLGQFLRSVEAFDHVEPLLSAIASLPQQPDGVHHSSDYWPRWHTAGRDFLSRVVGVIYKSLYDQFGDQAVDPNLAHRAYWDLFEQLGVGPQSRIVYATTNYDLIAETAFQSMGYLPDAGDMRSLPQESEGRVNAENLIEGVGRYIPVLHLHGRVGWFRSADARVVSRYPQSFVEGAGVPVVMLPDLEKKYDTDPLISAIWEEFATALRKAKRVLIMGHSLHDEALLQTLQANVSMTRVVVTVLEASNATSAPADSDADAVSTRIRERLPGAETVPFRFDANLSQRKHVLRTWRPAVAED